MASIRYGAIIPAAEIGARVVPYPAGTDPGAFLDGERPQSIVLTKAFDDSFVALARCARERGIPVVASFCDWHFDKPYNRMLSDLADAAVVQTRTMAMEFERHFGRTPLIIEEAYEGRRDAPRPVTTRPLRLVWYGHASNLDSFEDGYREVVAIRDLEIHLNVVTNRTDLVVEILKDYPWPETGLSVSVRPWTLAEQVRLVAESDIVLLPGRPLKESLVKGHNRLVQAIHAGRIALAYPLPQYRELADFCRCGTSVADGIDWVLSHPDEAVSRVAQGQAYIDTRFSPAAVGQRWREALDAVHAGRSRTPAA